MGRRRRTEGGRHREEAGGGWVGGRHREEAAVLSAVGALDAAAVDQEDLVRVRVRVRVRVSSRCSRC